MSVRNIQRGPTRPGGYQGAANAAPIYVDSDDNKLKFIPGGFGSTTEVEIVDASSTQTLTGKTVSGPLASTTLTAASSLDSTVFGKVLFLNNATGFATDLPAPAAGAFFTVINITANTSGNHTLVSSGSANIIKGNQNSVAGDAGDSGTADDTISFVANQSVAGDKVELYSDGTSWFAYAISRVAAGITFTQAS